MLILQTIPFSSDLKFGFPVSLKHDVTATSDFGRPPLAASLNENEIYLRESLPAQMYV